LNYRYSTLSLRIALIDCILYYSIKFYYRFQNNTYDNSNFYNFFEQPRHFYFKGMVTNVSYKRLQDYEMLFSVLQLVTAAYWLAGCPFSRFRHCG